MAVLPFLKIGCLTNVFFPIDLVFDLIYTTIVIQVRTSLFQMNFVRIDSMLLSICSLRRRRIRSHGFPQVQTISSPGKTGAYRFHHPSLMVYSLSG